MNEKLLNSLGMISDEMIVEAMNAFGKANAKRSYVRKVVATVAVATSLLLVIGLVAMPQITGNFGKMIGISEAGGGGTETQTIYVFYEGKVYINRGEYNIEILDECDYCGDTNLIHNQEFINNLDSNQEGSVYISRYISDIIYFKYYGENEEKIYILEIYEEEKGID